MAAQPIAEEEEADEKRLSGAHSMDDSAIEGSDEQHSIMREKKES